MPFNILITGKPGVGKTTVLNRVKLKIEDQNHTVGGVTCPEIRKEGRRVGFGIVDVSNNRRGILAHTGCEGPKVGKYKVNLKDLDEIGTSAIEYAIKNSDFIFIDEIAPMELHSKGFCSAVEAVLDSDKPVVAVIHKRSSNTFVSQVKARKDVLIFEVTHENRELLADEILNNLRGFFRT